MFTPSVGGPVLVSPTRPGIGDSARAQRGSWHAVAYWPDEVVAHTSPMIVWVVARAVDLVNLVRVARELSRGELVGIFPAGFA